MRNLLILLFLILSSNLLSQVEVSMLTTYRVPDSLSSSIYVKLPSNHPHKDFSWSADDIYFNLFPYRESVVDIYGENVYKIIFNVDTINNQVIKTYVDYDGNKRDVSLEYIDFFIFDLSGFFIELSSGANYAYYKVDNEICEYYIQEGFADECKSQFLRKNEFGEIEFITKENKLYFGKKSLRVVGFD